MYIKLDKRRITNGAKTVNLTGLDDENVTCAGFEVLSIDGPETATFPHELDFIVRMTMGTRTTPREGAQEEYGDIHITVIGPDEVVRATLKGQVLLTNAIHPGDAPVKGCYGRVGRRTAPDRRLAHRLRAIERAPAQTRLSLPAM